MQEGKRLAGRDGKSEREEVEMCIGVSEVM